MTTPEQAGTKPAEPSENDDLLGDLAALGLAFPSRSEQRQIIRRAGNFIRARLKTETDARFALLELAGEWAEECLQANEDKFSNAMQDRVNGAREKFLAALDRAALKPSPEPAVDTWVVAAARRVVHGWDAGHNEPKMKPLMERLRRSIAGERT